MKRAILGFFFLIAFSFSLFAQAGDSEYGHIVGDRKYFGRNYIVKNPRATLPPQDIPVAIMDSTQTECFVLGENTKIAFFDYGAFSPNIAVTGDIIHIVWWEMFSDNGFHEEVFYARSTDGGVSWSDSFCISNLDNISSVVGDVAAVGSNVYVVWEDWTGLPTGGIYFRKSTDGGTSWQSAIPVALRGVDDYDYYKPTVAARDSSVFVAFGKNVEQNSMFRFKKSSDCGETWGEETAISERGLTGYFPKLVLNPVGLHVGYQSGFEIYYNRSTDWGDTWGDDILISEEDGIDSQWPSIGVDDNGGVYVSWFDYKYSPYPWTGDIFLRRSTNNGETWDSIVSLTTNHLGHESDVCADTFAVHVVWHDERHEGPNYEIYHRKSANQGISWLEENRLTDIPNQSVDPNIATRYPFLHLSWVDSRDGHGDPFYKKIYWWVPGDANSDDHTNVSDIIFLINYLFINGPSPIIFESGDVNGDEQIDSADVIYLINYLFIGGPPPAEC